MGCINNPKFRLSNSMRLLICCSLLLSFAQVIADDTIDNAISSQLDCRANYVAFSSQSISNCNQYIVRSGDTLWSLAEGLANTMGLQTKKVMTALHQFNPDAFENGNINRLRVGGILSIPTAEQIQQLIHNQADTFSGKNMQVSAAELATNLQQSAELQEAVDVAIQQLHTVSNDINNISSGFDNRLKTIQSKIANIQTTTKSNNRQIAKLLDQQLRSFDLRTATPAELVSVGIISLVVVVLVWSVYLLLAAIFKRVKKQRSLDASIDRYQQAQLRTADASKPNTEQEADCQQIELAQAYLDLGEKNRARKLLQQVLDIGTDKQKAKAQQMLNRV